MSKKEDNIKLQIRALLENHFNRKNIGLDKIVIFGSFVAGGYESGSDIDIIIVSKAFKDKSIFERVKISAGACRKLVEKFQKPFDLMYYSDEEWENKDFLLINEAKEHGEVIYGR